MNLGTLHLELEDGEIHLGTFAGKPKLLFAFSPDCRNCIRFAVHLKQIYPAWKDAVQFFGIMLNPAAPLDLPNFIAEVGEIGFPLGYCPPGRFNTALDLPRHHWILFPTVIFLGAHGRCHQMLTPDDDILTCQPKRIEDELRKLVATPSATAI